MIISSHRENEITTFGKNVNLLSSVFSFKFLLVNFIGSVRRVFMFVQWFFITKCGVANITSVIFVLPMNNDCVSLKGSGFFKGEIAFVTFVWTAFVGFFQILTATMTLIFRHWFYTRLLIVILQSIWIWNPNKKEYNYDWKII